MNQLALIFLTLSVSYTESFAPHCMVSHHVNVASIGLHETSSHQDLYDAAEAAAFDAHDISDAGVEAAMMERAVILASNLMDQRDAQKAAQNLHEVSSENIVQAYDDYRSHEDHIMHFEKGLVEDSTDIAHSVIEAFTRLIEEGDE